jgi:predicted tellurium resistance membrane protein TerC
MSAAFPAALPTLLAAGPPEGGGLVPILAALVTLTAMEIVLGIDNVIFIAIVAARLPHEQQARARRWGLVVALGTRLLLLFTLSFLMGMDRVEVLQLSWLGIPPEWLGREVDVITVKDLVLLAGGLFLIGKSTVEIHHKLEGAEEQHAAGGRAGLARTVAEIAVLDIVFSLDSVITAVGMSRHLWVMVAAMVAAVGVMLLFSGKVADFVARHPTVKMLALAFLILIGVMLVADGLGQHVPKGYIYFAMAFSVAVEMLNLRVRARSAPVELREKRLPAGAEQA